MKTELQVFLLNAVDLPTLPSVALRMLELGEDPEAGLSEVAGVLANDSALSARLLKAANSPLYTARRQVDNLRQAVSLLGFNTAITLALSFSLQPQEDGGHLDKPAYWRRSVSAAVVSRVLAEHLHGGESGRFFLGALLQDIGMLVLDKAEPERYGKILEEARTHSALAQAEIEVFGFDHAQIGGSLLESWGLPETLWRPVRLSHDLWFTDETQPHQIDLCVSFSGELADFWLLDAQVRPDTRELSQWAGNHLGLDVDGFDAVVNRIAELLPEYEVLFDIPPTQDYDAATLLAEARDLSFLRTMKSVQDVGEYKVRSTELESLNRELEQQAYSDSLTGLLNRRRLQEILRHEFAAAAREGWPLSIGFVDVDHFKKVNDTYGHQGGDTVLVSMARVLAEQMRQSEFVARYGGEEFVVVFPGTSEKEAFTALERLRKRLAEEELEVDGVNLRATVSIGLATYQEGDRSGDHIESADALLRAADRALYAAKREGRNRTVVYQRSGD